MNRGFAVAVGVFAGIMSAVQFGNGLLDRIFFFLLAGLIAYAGCDAKGYARGIARAWREVSEWRPDWERIRASSERIAWLSLNGILWGSLIFAAIFSTAPLQIPVSPIGPEAFLGWAAGIIGMLCSYLGIVLAFDERRLHKAWRGQASIREDQIIVAETRIYFVKYANPVSAVFWVLHIIATLIWTVAGNFPSLLRDLLVLGLKIFAYTHTAERRVCFLDAVVLSAVGWYFSASIPYAMFIFAAIGFVIGRYHYPLTLDLAKRMEKRFAPKPAPRSGGL